MLAQAQITNKIWNLTLGVNTKQQVINVINNRQLKIHDRGNDYIACTPTTFRFGGESWNFAKFRFFNVILQSISFSYTCSISVRESFDRLKKSLNNKYRSYITDKDLNTYGDWYIDYDDGKTMISLTYNIEPGHDFVGIIYTDVALLLKENHQSETEL